MGIGNGEVGNGKWEMRNGVTLSKYQVPRGKMGREVAEEVSDGSAKTSYWEIPVLLIS